MTAKKTGTLNLRVDPALKEAARIAAIREHRSIANLVEWLIRQHCEAAGIAIPEQSELFKEPDDE
ncbi:MAG: toxin-antitoxin system HicB family antitoxin [Xanthomonadales bacterium]|nr:toxin-antitoxin system HicB family antitoxin [Xanthomonadales bacterium]